MMKKKFKAACSMLLVGAISVFVLSCSSKASNTDTKEESCCSSATEKLSTEESCCSKSQEEEQATAYYFHATRRCATCQAVEKVSKEYIEANYKEKVNFISINREEEQNKELVEKYEIAGQTLIIVFGDEVVNLTTDAFMNARSNPEKLEEIIKNTIESHIM